MAELRWSNTIPSEEGWYWFRGKAGGDRFEDPCPVSVYKSNVASENCLMVHFDTDFTERLSTLEGKGDQWCGPLELPTEYTTQGDDRPHHPK